MSDPVHEDGGELGLPVLRVLGVLVALEGARRAGAGDARRALPLLDDVGHVLGGHGAVSVALEDEEARLLRRRALPDRGVSAGDEPPPPGEAPPPLLPGPAEEALPLEPGSPAPPDDPGDVADVGSPLPSSHAARSVAITSTAPSPSFIIVMGGAHRTRRAGRDRP